MSIDFKQLRIANIARQAEWQGNERADLAFRALEVADEAGELMGAIKKVVRAQRGIAGSTLWGISACLGAAPSLSAYDSQGIY